MGRLADKIRLFLRICIVTLIFVFAGFIAFANSIDKSNRASIESAEGIIALTGGASRIPEAVKLLKSGKGDRLLITGVNPSTTRKMLQEVLPKNDSVFECCIDIDHIARDTIGNAEAARAWVDKNRFKSIIVVTSSYHMPRSMVELRRAMPEVKLVPFPVISKSFRSKNWWVSPDTLRLLVSEYVKFIPAIAKLGVAKLSNSVLREQSISASADPALRN